MKEDFNFRTGVIVNAHSISISIPDKHCLSLCELSVINNIIAEMTINQIAEQPFKIEPTEKWFFFNRLNVPPKVRRKGIATAMMTTLVQLADNYSINIMNTINPSGDMTMAQLVTFYAKYGFESVGPVEYGFVIRKCK